MTPSPTLAVSRWMKHDLAHVQNSMKLLEAHGIVTWLFGGWAEELHGMTPPRGHRDIDLLYLAESFRAVDRFLRAGEVQEIAAKRFPHKRAFLSAGVMTEIILVRPDLTTDFWSRTCFVWPPDTFDHRCDETRVASSAALTAYRAAHRFLRADMMSRATTRSSDPGFGREPMA